METLPDAFVSAWSFTSDSQPLKREKTAVRTKYLTQTLKAFERVAGVFRLVSHLDRYDDINY